MSILKARLIESGKITAHRAIQIDNVQFYIYGVYFATLFGSLIAFKVLDSRHKIKIKKSQLSLAALFGLFAVAIPSLQTTSGAVTLHIVEKAMPLQQYPKQELKASNVLFAISLLFSVSATLVICYLTFNIGR